MFEGEGRYFNQIPTYCCEKTKRKATRRQAKGIITLVDDEKPVVNTILDIAPGGVSFIHPSVKNIINREVNMDIIIYGYQTNLEYFMSQVAGRVTSDYVMHYPLNKTPIRRIGVEFLGLEVSAKNLLITFFNLI